MRAAGMSSIGMPAAPPLSRKIARQAVEWYLLEQSGQATPAELAASAAWRAQDAAHAHAWQRVQQVSHTAGLIPAGLAAPVLRRPQRRIVMKTLLALLAAPTAWLLVRPDALADYRSGVGQQRSVTLPDGGRLLLNTDSAVSLAYGAQERVVTLLRGELLVDTHADHAGGRAFFVATPHGRIRALGTRFTVRLDDGGTRVTVLEHAVEIQPDNGAATVRRVAAGQHSYFDADHATVPTQAPAQAGAWSRGILVANDMRLDAFAAELARYRHGIVRVEERAAALRLTGAFQLDDTDGVLASLADLLPVDVLYRTPYWVTVVAQQP